MAKQSARAVQKSGLGQFTVAILVSCYNEEMAIAKVVKDFRAVLSTVTIFVFDNDSTYETAAAARAAGAEVYKEKRQGKGYVVQRTVSRRRRGSNQQLDKRWNPKCFSMVYRARSA